MSQSLTALFIRDAVATGPLEGPRPTKDIHRVQILDPNTLHAGGNWRLTAGGRRLVATATTEGWRLEGGNQKGQLYPELKWESIQDFRLSESDRLEKVYELAGELLVEGADVEEAVARAGDLIERVFGAGRGARGERADARSPAWPLVEQRSGGGLSG